MTRPAETHARGFTLIELVVSIVAAGILFALLSTVLGPEAVRSTAPLFSLRATELGQSYLEEILGKRYDHNDPPGSRPRCGEAGAPACAGLGTDGQSRNQYDDADDYNGLNETPIDASGAVRPGYSDFRVAVAVSLAGTELGLASNADAKRISLTVTDPQGGTHRFSAYKTHL